MRGWKGLKVCQRGIWGTPYACRWHLPVAPWGRSWSWAHLHTSHRTRCASLSPAVSGQKSCFLTETAVSGVLFLTVNASGVQKVLDRSHGVETHGARRALKRGNFFHEQVFFHKKQVLFSQKIFLMIKTVNILSIFFKKKPYKPLTAKTTGCVWPPGNRGFGGAHRSISGQKPRFLYQYKPRFMGGTFGTP